MLPCAVSRGATRMAHHVGNGLFLRQSRQPQWTLRALFVVLAVSIGCLAPGGSLVTIDPMTGHPTLKGPLGVGTNTTMHDLAFDPAPGGALYGWGQAGLHVVNPSTGAASLVDEFGPESAIGGYGLAFNAAG